MSAFAVDYDRYIHSDAWRSKRAARLAVDGGLCVVCKRRAANVHHLTYERLGAEDVRHDLVSVCRRCHARLDELEKMERRAARAASSKAKGGKMYALSEFMREWGRVVLWVLVVAVVLAALLWADGVGAAPVVSGSASMSQAAPVGWRIAVPDRRTIRYTPRGGTARGGRR